MIKTNQTVHPEFSFIEKLRHYLPAQAPLKDFIHHNSLHAFQDKPFFDALSEASALFGYKTFLSVEEYRAEYKKGRINKDILLRVISDKWPATSKDEALNVLLHKELNESVNPRIGLLREHWKTQLHFDMDGAVHPILFRIVCSFLDQGVSAWPFPYNENGLIASIRDLESNNLSSLFNNESTKQLLFSSDLNLELLLKIIIGNEELFEQYVFDQQFAHQGWSGIINNIELNPNGLLEPKNISLTDLIILELLLEFDALETAFKDKWKAISNYVSIPMPKLFDKVERNELNLVYETWQEAFEWSYHDQVLFGVIKQRKELIDNNAKSFQALFCIDDRECSFRRYVEQSDTSCETFGTAGFFNVEFYFKPINGKFYTKLCPAPVNPKHLVKEIGSNLKKEKDFHFNKQNTGLFSGWVIAQTLGFWSAIKLFINIFKPSFSPATASSLKHMDKNSKLTIVNHHSEEVENGLQIGFTYEEMANRLEGLFKSIGLTTNFAPIIYTVGHGSSSVNNPHYSAYDCGACSGRPGSVNARVFSYMANLKEVRNILKLRGINIPDETKFVGALHDTTRDEIVFYDEDLLNEVAAKLHRLNVEVFKKAIALNAKERSRRFSTIDTKQSPEKILMQVRKRSVTIFEPRPELNHATNALCIVGSRNFTKDIFLDRRAFFNSYDYKIDDNGDLLFGILKAVAPVCGGINLEYYFSRVDNQKLGAGSKLPHNVMGLIAVANGTEGDLRPGLPKQMIEFHEPVRLMVVVEQKPEIVLSSIQRNEPTYEWFINNWIKLVCVNPADNKLFLFERGSFSEYKTVVQDIPVVNDLNKVIEENDDYLPVMILNS